jgi:hypothetical protein
MKRQKGVTISGLLFASIFLIVLALLGFKLVPVFLEYNAIQRAFRSVAEDPALQGASREQIRRAFVSRALVDDIKAITPEQIEIAREGNDLVLSSAYDVKVALFRNVSACLDFQPTSR